MSRPAPHILPLLAACYFIMGTGSLAFVGTLPAIAEATQLSRGTTAVIYAVYSITFALGAPLLQSVLGDRVRRHLLMAGLAGLALGSLVTAAANGPAVLVFGRFLAAVGSAAIGPVASALGASLVVREQQGRALAVIFSGIAIASVLGVPMAVLMADTIGWRLAFVAIAALCLILLALVGTTIADSSWGERMHPLAALRLAAQPVMALSLVVMLAEMAALFASYTMITPILSEFYGLDASAVASALMVFGIAGVSGNVLARKLAGWWSAERSIRIGLGCFILASVLLIWAPAVVAAAWAVLIAWALGNDIFMPAQQRRMVELAPDARGMALAMNASAIYLGSSLGAAVAGWLDRDYGLTALPWASIVLAVMGLAALEVSIRRHRALAVCPAE